MKNLAENNRLRLAGKVISEPKFTYSFKDRNNNDYEEKFYEFELEVPRLSDATDVIKCVISEKILDGVTVDAFVDIKGQLRTNNEMVGEKNRLVVYSFIRDIEVITEEELKAIRNPNEINLSAFICKPPVYRETPNNREISDLLLAVNRSYYKSDYIPAIAWGRNAKYVAKLPVGSNIKLTGRIQARQYIKKEIIDGVETPIQKTAYELSLNNVMLLNPAV